MPVRKVRAVALVWRAIAGSSSLSMPGCPVEGELAAAPVVLTSGQRGPLSVGLSLT